MSALSNSIRNKRVPKVIVFDLDYTLWPFWVDTHVTAPFRRSGEYIVDAHNWRLKHYPEVPEILKKLTNDGYEIGIASRTSAGEAAEMLLDMFGWSQYIKYKQIFPGCKVTHFINIRKESNVEYSDMMFFDDEPRNIKEVEKIGVTSILVKQQGMCFKLLAEGFSKFASTST